MKPLRSNTTWEIACAPALPAISAPTALAPVRPEPYKGKGVKYVDERIRRKVGKTGA